MDRKLKRCDNRDEGAETVDVTFSASNAMAVGVGFVLDSTGKIWVDLDSAKCEVVDDEPGKEGL